MKKSQSFEFSYAGPSLWMTLRNMFLLGEDDLFENNIALKSQSIFSYFEICVINMIFFINITLTKNSSIFHNQNI